MFSSISWSQYITWLLVGTIVYYFFIWIVYFKGKMPSLALMNRVRTPSFHGEDEPDEVMTTVQHIMEEILPVFNGRTSKNELLFALQSRLNKYSDWEQAGFRETLNELIVAMSQSKCSIRLSEQDLGTVWLKA